MKNIRMFYPNNCQFLVVKFSVYLNRRVLVMIFVKSQKPRILILQFDLPCNKVAEKKVKKSLLILTLLLLNMTCLS